MRQKHCSGACNQRKLRKIAVKYSMLLVLAGSCYLLSLRQCRLEEAL